MRLLYFAAGLLWMLFGALLFSSASVAFNASMSLSERATAVLVIALLTAPVVLQLRATHRRIREMKANRIRLGPDGIEIQLAGRAREWKGLPEVPQTLLPWNQLLSIASEKRRFIYPSVIPLGYPLEVFTLFCKSGGISFTRECIPNARRIAEEIATRLGCEL